MELESKRLLLTSISQKHALEVFSYRSDAITNQYQGWIPNSLAEVEDFITNKVCKTFNVSDTWSQMVIICQESNKIIGDIGIHFIDDKQVEIGCTLCKEQHGKGFANEALRAVINLLFKQFSKHRIIASIDPQNINSAKMVERLGFKKEAHFRKSLCIDGEWVDDVVYAILAEEW